MVRLTQLSLCNNQIQARLNDRPPRSYRPPDRTNTHSYAATLVGLGHNIATSLDKVHCSA
jgi:hypothetical protein